MANKGAHALVLGAGVAGLLTARVLSEFYGSVTMVERDVLPDRPEHRKGVPQGLHLHNFLSRGTQLIGELFPGILEELAAAGAAVDDGDDLSRLYVRVAGYELNPPGKLADPVPLAAYQASRPFVEFHLRRRVAALANVTILDNHKVIEPRVTAGTVTGARIINHVNGIESTVDADLVIDTTGRASRTRAFLESYGFGPVPQDMTPPTWGYSSHLMHIPSGRIGERMAFVSQGSSAPGAVLMAYEHDTWMLAISCPVGLGPPPKTFIEMLEMADRILPPAISTVLHDATPIGEIAISRATATQWQRYDRMSQLPTGLLVLGDALCTLNPLYGQGMTMAAMHAFTLRDCLQAGDTDMARFYSAAVEHIAPVWAMNQANELPAAPNPSLQARMRSWMQRAALAAATTNIAVAERLLRVRGLIDPPTRLQDPALLVQILLTNLRHPRIKPLDHLTTGLSVQPSV
ncbi:FAD-dependent monooxygenase [Mycobacterium gastri]|uniref:FAD-dependent monooxygenase n=1 Tax=Mycobacterium gastri TaxID=1777 RepID=UPI0003E518B2|nr:FAD-dependent monooxygenase [Mycobacterium gastri]ETW23963.1 FAD-dependent oxidoreductase [Mycobacterium gastri 'Wayne']